MKTIILFIALSWMVTFPSLSQSPGWLWAKSIGGMEDEWAYAITTDPSGNVYTTGYFQETVDFDPGKGTFNVTSAGGLDIFISKFDASGNFLWVKSIGGAGDDYARAIALDASGNIYTTGSYQAKTDFNPNAGTFNLTASGYEDVFISKLSSDGNFIFAKTIGGNASVTGFSIAIDGLGNVYITGDLTGSADFDPGAETSYLTSSGNDDIFILKLNASGNFIWAKEMGESIADFGVAVKVDHSGNIYYTGNFTGTVDFDPGSSTFNLTSAGSWDIFISKLDSNGNFIWAVRIGGDNLDESHSIALDDSGNIYTTGRFTGIADFDPGKEEFIMELDGNYGIFISKLDNSGNFVWAKGFGGTGYDIGWALTIDHAGNVYTTGSFYHTVDFDPGKGIFNLTSTEGSVDIFISKLDSAGDFVWAKAEGGRSYDYGQSIVLDPFENVYVTGAYYEFSIPFGSDTLMNAGKYDVFISKLEHIITGIDKLESIIDISAFPNPSNGKFTIINDNPISAIEIYTSLGERIFSNSKINGQTSIEIDLSAAGKGIYIVNIHEGTKIYIHKVVVQ